MTTHEFLKVTINGHTPQLHAESWVAPNASLLGQISLADGVSVWYGATLRTESEPIEVGADSNIQDGCTVHADPGFPVRVGSKVCVGHNAVLHGCTVGDGALVGMGAIVLNGAVVGEGSVIAAGALVPQGVEIPPRSLVAGVPGKVRRTLSDMEVTKNLKDAEIYRRLASIHRGAAKA